MYARGALVGLTRGTTRAHVARATLEAIAYQTRDVLEAMAARGRPPPAELRVDGGATENDFLCQFQADVLGLPILRPRVRETTGLGRRLPGGARGGTLARPGGAPRASGSSIAPSSPPCPPRGGTRSTPAGAGPWTAPGSGPARSRDRAECRAVRRSPGFRRSARSATVWTRSIDPGEVRRAPYRRPARAAGAPRRPSRPRASRPPIEDELVLQTPVSKFVVDAALKAFADYAKEKWGVTVKTNAQYAGTPVSYGRIVEWKGKPEADIFWGGESALFDKLAEQKLLVKHEVPREIVDAIPAGLGKPKPIPLKDPDGYWIGTALEPYGLVYHPRLIRRLGRAGAEGLGGSPPSEAQGQRRPVRADPLLVEPRDLRDHPPEPGRPARLGVAQAARRQLRRSSPPGAATCRRSWPRASSRPASRCPRTWRSRRCWPASTSSSSRRRTPS